ncbi:MAG: 4-alpha-glucanotransferase [Dethiosulfovibrio peptidovorans]|nr:MAG: 4-alpha-glucanotransferase [Dethiosulfovibrio peptidovorans]
MRKAAVLLPLSSLPSPWGAGDLGIEARQFVQSLARSGVGGWQVLPLTELSPVFGYSPYSPLSAFAGDVLYVSPEMLAKEGWIKESDLPKRLPTGPANFGQARRIRLDLIRLVWERHRNNQEFSGFRDRNDHWLREYCLFKILKNRHGDLPWNLWPEPYRLRDEGALDVLEAEAHNEIDQLAFGQFLFFRQEQRLRQLCTEKGVDFLGDLPIYVTHDSPDVWGHPELFQLGDDLQPTSIAGVPPDYYSVDGQTWGNPLYRWENHEATDFNWWMSRLTHSLNLYDRVRLDHFRGLLSYWAIPSNATSAREGRWQDAPSQAFFQALRQKFPSMPFLAEDLGIITPDVQKAMKDTGISGMAVLQFAFDSDVGQSPYAPHNLSPSITVYTGTHDNDTIKGWYQTAPDKTKENLRTYTGTDVEDCSASWTLIRLALGSVADMAVIPAQDLMDLGSDARINRPSTIEGNWTWRLSQEGVPQETFQRLERLLKIYGRSLDEKRSCNEEIQKG